MQSTRSHPAQANIARMRAPLEDLVLWFTFRQPFPPSGAPSFAPPELDAEFFECAS
jgi:hypothetical protein